MLQAGNAAYGDNASQLGEAEISVTATFAVRVVAAPPCIFGVTGRKGQLENMAVTDRADDEGGRTLVRSINLVIVDAAGNKCGEESLAVAGAEPSSLLVRARIEYLDDESAGEEGGGGSGRGPERMGPKPTLEGGCADGWVTASSTWESETNSHSFDEGLIIATGSGKAPWVRNKGCALAW